MWPRDVRIDRAGPHRVERRAADLRRLLGAVALRETHRVNLAVAARRRRDRVVDCRSHVLDPTATRSLVNHTSQLEIRLPNFRGCARPIAQLIDHFGIDIFSESCITRYEGPRVGVGLAGTHGSQL